MHFILLKKRVLVLFNSSPFAISFAVALIWKFLTKYGNKNSIFHLDKISADNKC